MNVSEPLCALLPLFLSSLSHRLVHLRLVCQCLAFRLPCMCLLACVCVVFFNTLPLFRSTRDKARLSIVPANPLVCFLCNLLSLLFMPSCFFLASRPFRPLIILPLFSLCVLLHTFKFLLWFKCTGGAHTYIREHVDEEWPALSWLYWPEPWPDSYSSVTNT